MIDHKADDKRAQGQEIVMSGVVIHLCGRGSKALLDMIAQIQFVGVWLEVHLIK